MLGADGEQKSCESMCSAMGIQQQWVSRIESLLCVPVGTGAWALQLNLQEVQGMDSVIAESYCRSESF